MKDFDSIQKVGQQNFEAAVQSMGEVNKSFQAIAAEVTDYSKKAYEDGTATVEKLIGAKSLDQAVQIQSDYARKAYEDYVAGVSKIGEMYAELAKEAYKPVEKAMAQK